MRFPPAGWAWPPGPRVAAAHNSGVDGRRDGREKGPMQATSGPQRDKTRPAARLGGPPGTKLSQQAPKRRFRPTFRMQGELCTASATNTTSTENFIPHAVPLPVQNSPSKRPWQAHPVQNSPSTPGSTAHPVQNSPSKPQNANFGPLFACRENFLPLPPPTTRAGRTLYRFRHQHDEHGELYPACGATSGTKLSQHARLGGPPGTKLSQQAARRPTRYKTLPASPKTPISAHFSHAGRTLYRFRHQHDKQGEKSHAPTPHRTHQRAPPQISHAIRLNELSTKPRNVAIPTT